MALTDLFGHPVAPVLCPTISRKRVPRIVSEEARRERLRRHLELSRNLVLFDELLDYLKAPLLRCVNLPAEYVSDIGRVDVIEAEDDESLVDATSIPYEGWGKPLVTDSHNFHWSMEGLLYTQVRLFWRSMEELVLANNAQEKWSVLRWIFRPAIWKYYVYDRRSGNGRSLDIHERDEPFGFHNCCIAARVDEDAVREGVRRNIPAEVIKAVERVCRF